ncbi:hypothetical protein SFRURICE_010863 [Spodoptera frugiperda]|uniref:SFRICE_009307 n=1 Tax=Spodoptera frugiperda TaxID=7108 RepID=A0A2H1VG00_SPOFR|nr:hypothetical protein SFRURICE_010863 [Spodoptera frugiperda]
MEFLSRKVKSHGQIDARQVNGALDTSREIKKRSETAMSPAPPAQRDKTSATHAAVKQSYATSVGKCTYEMERDRIGIWGSGDSTSASKVSGLDRLRHPGLNKVRTHLTIP